MRGLLRVLRAAFAQRGRRLLLLGALIGLLLAAGSAMAFEGGESDGGDSPSASKAAGRPAAPPAPSPKTDIADLKGKDFVPGEVLVRFDATVDANGKAETRRAAGTKLLQHLPVRGLEYLKITDGRSVAKAIEALQRRPGVQYAQPNYIYETTATPNDPRFSQTWGLHNPGGTIGGVAAKADADIDAPEAWDWTTSASPITVAVVDTGVDYNHPDLAGNMWTNPGEIPGNGIDDDGNGRIDDVRGWDFVGQDNNPLDGHGHGTHVAGTIGAVGNNGIGVAGVAWNVQLMAVQVFDAAGTATSVSVSQGLAYAARAGAQVVNASLGGTGFDQAERDAIAAWPSSLFVVAAGNNRSNNETTAFYPCSFDLANILCVAATDEQDALSVWPGANSGSNWGATRVDMGAPGSNIMSTLPNNTYGAQNGTSMATPHVAGAAALVWAQEPMLEPTQLKQRLMDSGDPLPSLAGITVSGKRLNLYRALNVYGVSDIDCQDANGTDDVSWDDETNPTFGPQSAEVYTCTVTDPAGDPVDQMRVNLENLNGANDLDNDADGGPGSKADAHCVTGSNGRCTITVAPTQGESGTANLCFWADTVGDDDFDRNGPEEDGGKCHSEGVHQNLDDARLTDVTTITWTDPAMYLDCDDSTGDDDQLNSLAAKTTETYTCKVTNQGGQPLSGLWIDYENMAGVNDLDNDAVGGPGDQADGGCQYQTNGSGECTVQVAAHKNAVGIDQYCFWVDRDGDHGFDISSTETAGADDGGYCDDSEEPWNEPENTDREDKTRIKWTDCTAVWDGSLGTANNLNGWRSYHADSNGVIYDTNWTFLVPRSSYFPTADDRVCIDEGFTVNTDLDETIGALDNEGTVNMSGGSLTIQGLGSEARASQAGTFNLSGGEIRGDGPLHVNKVLTWSGGHMSGAGLTSVVPNGFLQVTGDARVINGRVIENAGTVQLFNGGAMGSHSGTGTLRNLANGTVRKAGTGLSHFCGYWCIELVNNGLVTAESGELRLHNHGSGNGDWETTGTGQITFHGTYQLGGGTTFRGTGVSIDNGTTTLSGTVDIPGGSILHFNGGVIEGTHTITGSGTLRWADGHLNASETHKVTTFAADLLVQLAADARVINGRRIENHGRIEFTGDTKIGSHSGTGTVHNNTGGRVFKSGGTGEAHFCAYWCVNFDNDGRAWSTAGTLRMDYGTSSGRFESIGTGGIRFNSEYNLAAGTRFDGTNNLLNGRTRATGAITLTDGSVATLHGDLVGNPTFTGPGTLRWTGGTMDEAQSTTIAAGTTLEIRGSTRLINGRVLDNHGTIDFVGDHAVGSHSGLGTIHNHPNALIVKSAGSDRAHFTDYWGVGLENDGVVRSDSGLLDLSGGSNDRISTGAYRASAGAELRFGGGDHRLGQNAKLTGAGTIGLTGGRVFINATTLLTSSSDFTGLLDMTGGELSIQGTSRIGAGTVARLAGATVSGTGTLEVAGMLSWPSGHMTDAGTTKVLTTGELRLTDLWPRLINDRVLSNEGTLTFVGKSAIGSHSGGGTVNNQSTGLIRKIGNEYGSFCGYWCVPLNNNGTVSGDDGRFVMDSSGAGNGAWRTTSTGTLEFHGAFALNSGTSYSGTGISFEANHLNLQGNQTISENGTLTFKGGTAHGTHTFHGPGTLRLVGGELTADATHHVTTLASTARVAVAGDFRLVNGRILDNFGVVDFVGDTKLGSHSGTGTVNNKPGGVVRKSAGTGEAHFCAYWCVSFNNAGQATAASGTLRINEGTSSGRFTSNAGVVKQVGTHTFDGATFAGTGALLEGHTVATGALTVEPSADLTLNGTLTGDHTIAGGGTLRWIGGSLNGEGTTAVASGTRLRVQAPVSILNGRVLDNAGIIEFAGDHSFGSHSGIGRVWNRTGGLITKTSGTGQAHFANYWGVSLQNDGTLESRSGRLNVNGGLDAYDGATKTLTKGRYVARNGAAIVLEGMTVEQNKAAIELRGAGAALRPYETGNALANLGSNAAGASLTVADGAELSTSAPELVNAGTVYVGSDSTLTAPAYRQTGGLTHLEDTTPDNETTARLVAPTVTLTGGTFKGNGEVVGNVTNTGAVMAPGNSPGTLTVDGTYTQSGTGVLQIEVNGKDAGQFDVLNVKGTATLGGTMQLVPSNGFDPIWGLTLPVLTTTESTGSFQSIEGLTIAPGASYDVEVVDGVLTVITKDTAAPTNPPLSSPSHTLSTWSATDTVTLSLAGATDNFSGVDGFSVTWDTSATSTPPATVSHAANQATATSPKLAAGSAHYAHVRTVDKAGNWSGAAHLGPFHIDAATPVGPGATSGSHSASQWSTDPTVDVALTAPSSVSGIDGYAVVWDTSASTVPGTTKTHPATTAALTSPTLVAGNSHYVHIRAVNKAGTWGATTHLGPFFIDTAAVAGPTLASESHSVSQWSADPTIDIALTAPATTSGVDGYAVVWDTSASTVPGTTKTHGAVTTVTSPTLAAGNSHFVHIRAVNKAGTWGATTHLGPFFIDPGATAAPGLSSTSHKTSQWSNVPTVDVSVTAPTPPSGVAGYAVVWDSSPTTTPGSTVTHAASTKTLASPALPSGNAHYVHVRARTNSGSWGPASHLGPFWIDTSAPAKVALTAPSAKQPFSLVANAKGIPQVKAAWKAPAEADSGIATYRVGQRVMGPTSTKFSSVTWSAATTATSFTVAKATPGATYCFQVQATDKAGNQSVGAERCAGVPIDDTALAMSKTGKKSHWKTVKAAALYRGAARSTTTKGATLTAKTVQTRRLSLVATRCATCGSVQVLWKGKSLGTFSLAGKAANKVVIPIKTFKKVETGALVVKVTTAKKTVTIDGIAVSTR
ncbi:MAG TPA: S8 family serine peptidase [Egibacteraceae bacterium]|nr:S8 family serine peptidase [Egibacteraceae bacterium]